MCVNSVGSLYFCVKVCILVCFVCVCLVWWVVYIAVIDYSGLACWFVDLCWLCWFVVWVLVGAAVGLGFGCDVDCWFCCC